MVTLDRSSRLIAVEVLGLGIVPAILVGIHFLVPPGLEEALTLRPGAVTPLTLFSAAFFHLGLEHLLGNLAAYAIGVGYAYFIALVIRERRWFWASTVALVVGLPIVVNWSSIHLMTAVLGGWAMPIRGFSGISAGFGGFAFMATLVYVRKRADSRSAFFIGLAVILVLLWEVLLIYADAVPTLPTLAMLAGVVLALIGVAVRWYPRGRSAPRNAWRSAGVTGLLVAWMVVVLSVLVAGMFPAEVVVGGRFINIFAHSTGFGLGGVVTGWGYRYWRRRPSLRELWRATVDEP